MKLPPLRTLLTIGAASGVALVATACSPVEDSDGPTSSEPADRDTGSGTFTAGEYSAEGSYSTPGGQEKLKVDLTLAEDGTISALTVTPEGQSPNSKIFQGKFASGISDVAVGKNIASLKVDKVAGSSLSSGGFNAALDDIAGQAQA